MEAIEALIVTLHPDAFLGIDEETVDTTLDAPLAEKGGRITGHFLGDRVKVTEVHALFQPEFSFGILPDLIDIVVTQRRRVIGIGIEGTETITVIAVQTIGSAYPDITLGVLEQIVNRGV